jgi:nitrite reductase/ring-hydroxylating ferredoxin subunit
VAEKRVARVEEVPDDRGMSCTVDGKLVALFRVGDQVHAVGGRCPHQFADLSDGWVEDGYVVCANHLWCFALADGSMPGNDIIRLPVHAVRVEDGWVHVTLQPEGEMPRSTGGT